MDFEIWLLFLVSELVLCLTPGPAVLLIVSQGMRRGFRASVAGSAGVLSVNALWFTFSAVGLGGILLASATLFGVVKWVGAAYLVFLGLRMLISSSARGGGGRASGGAPRRDRMFTQGLLTQIANPKAIVFFTALLPQFISPEGDLVLQFAVLGVTSVAAEFCVLLAYGWTAQKGARLVGAGAAGLFERVGGALLIFAGIGLAVADKR